MSDIFICYSKTDASIASQLVEHLQKEGWSVFIDRKPPVGRRWHREIEKELYAAKAVVVLWSEKSCESDYVLDEAEHGKRKDILFPAFIASVEYPYGFGRIQAANLIDWENTADHTGLAELLNSLRQHLNDHANESTVTKEPKPAQQTTRPTFTPGQTFRDPLKAGGEGPQMVVIPAGHFLMGSPSNESGRRNSERPQHEVQIAEPFAIGVHVVAFDDYDLFSKSRQKEKPDAEGRGREKHPVINVSWHKPIAHGLASRPDGVTAYPAKQYGNMLAVQVFQRRITWGKIFPTIKPTLLVVLERQHPLVLIYPIHLVYMTSLVSR